MEATDLSQENSRWKGLNWDEIEQRPELAGLSDVGKQAMKELAIERDEWRAAWQSQQAELKNAAELQRSMMASHGPALAGWDIGVAWQPAKEVGGDLVDFIDLAGRRVVDQDGERGKRPTIRRVLSVVGDVVGKGQAAAMVTGMAHLALHAEARRESDPEKILQAVNFDLIEAAGNLGMFVTALAVRVEEAKSGKPARVDYARAGHPPLLVFDGKKRLINLPVRAGQPLNLFQPEIDPLIDTGSVIISPKGRFFGYSDGITETPDKRNQDDEFGVARLIQVISDNWGLDAQDLCERVLIEVSNYEGGADPRTGNHDDRTIVAFHRL